MLKALATRLLIIEHKLDMLLESRMHSGTCLPTSEIPQVREKLSCPICGSLYKFRIEGDCVFRLCSCAPPIQAVEGLVSLLAQEISPRPPTQPLEDDYAPED